MTEISRTNSTAANSPMKFGNRKSSGNTPLLKSSAKGSASPYNTEPPKGQAIAYFKVALSALSPVKRFGNQPSTDKAAVSKDVSILHESKIFKSLLEASYQKKKTEVKRDPILQNNEEQSHQFKPCYQRVASVERNSKCRDENVKRAKKQGDFNERFNPRPEEPRPQGLRPFAILPSESLDENPRRQLKSVRAKSAERFRNPLTEGDLESMIVRKPKKIAEKIDDLQNLNDKKYLLPAERGRSSQGRLFRGSSVANLMVDSSPISVERERLLTEQEKRVRGGIKGILEYDDGPNFRDTMMSDKCHTIKFSDILKSQIPTEDRIFARKKTLEY